MTDRITIQPDATDLKMAIVVSSYHAWATDRLLEGAIDRWQRLNGSESNLTIAPAAGAWELVSIARALADTEQYNAIVALGAIIQGETTHYDEICRGVTQGLTDITIHTGTPIGFGVLTCQTTEQAEARSGGAIGNKGADAVSAAVHSAQTLRAIKKTGRTG